MHFGFCHIFFTVRFRKAEMRSTVVLLCTVCDYRSVPHPHTVLLCRGLHYASCFACWIVHIVWVPKPSFCLRAITTTIFLVKMLCNLLKVSLHFGATQLQLHGWRISEVWNPYESTGSSCHLLLFTMYISSTGIEVLTVLSVFRILVYGNQLPDESCSVLFDWLW
jgi:hypothetical protein